MTAHNLNLNISNQYRNMGKLLVLIRHAKSDWSSGATIDYERPLNERGHRDAPMMGMRLLQKSILPDLIIASTAIRAATTARLIAKEIGYAAQDILWQEDLYHCMPPVFENVIEAADINDSINTVFIVAHNPGITDYANEKTAGLHLANMPTCSMVGINLDIDSWQQLREVSGTLNFFDYPKNQ